MCEYNMKKGDDFRNCLNCGQPVNLKKDKYVLLGTYNREHGLPSEENFLHFQCWLDYFNKCVLNKARSTVQGMQQQAIQLFNAPFIQRVIQGTPIEGALSNMLNRDLNEKQSFIIPKRTVEEKIKDDRERKNKRSVNRKK